MAQFIYFLVVLFSFGLVEARNKTPLIEEDFLRTRNKAAECVFGKELREIGSTWIPDLGPPIGYLYCMKCECVKLQKKRRIVARVHCRSIKNECPEAACEEPVLLKGQCCKTCPGEIKNNNFENIISTSPAEDEEKGTKYFSALLTGRSSLVLKNEPMTNEINKNNVVATARFTFHKKNLHYSFFISEKAARPRTLQFVDNEGQILEEFTISRPGEMINSVYQNATRKVCGVWKRLPRDYRRQLKQGKLYVVLIWGQKDQTEYTLSGQITKNSALVGSEMLSSLLEPAPGSDGLLMTGAGGTAMVSVSTSLTPSIHLAIIFNGLFTSTEIAQVPIKITLSYEEKKQIILQETVLVAKPATDLNLLEVSSTVNLTDLRLLTRGRLLLTVSSISKPEALRLSGIVIAKASCELFQATLASSTNDRKVNPNGTSGLAWLYLNNEGNLIYNIHIDNLQTDGNFVITLIDTSTKRRTELEDLTPDFARGWANGTLDKLSPKVLEPLYAGNLAVNVQYGEHSLIKGNLKAKPVDDARDAPAPILLKRERGNYSLPPSATGLAWIVVDNECHLHYDVSLTGFGNNEKNYELYMEMLPRLLPGAPIITRHLDDFEGNQVEGSPIDVLRRDELSRLFDGVSFIKVRDRDTKNILLAATVKQVQVPIYCRPTYEDNDVPVSPEDRIDSIKNTGECLYEEKFYQEETTWVSNADPCTMCFCQNGVSKCDTMTCPEIKCASGVKVNIPGECCPICSETTKMVDITQKCIFNGKSYTPGAKFHPFLMPMGFDNCTECVCDPLVREIKCSRLSDNEKSCCRNCKKPESPDTEPQSDDQVPFLITEISRQKSQPDSNVDEILANGGCKNLGNPKKPYANGALFHPYIDSLGEYKCVTCKCENGIQNCKREKCDLPKCKRMIELRRNKKMINQSDFCCKMKECRKLRHKKNRHNS